MMRKIVTIMLLVLYSVCSTGGTIYLHQCGERTAISVVDNQKTPEMQCPICTSAHTQDETNQTEHSDHQGCCASDKSCQDIQVELKKDESKENHSSIQKTYSFNPSIVLIPWILTYFDYTNSAEENNRYVAERRHVFYSCATYLSNCNLRI